MSLFSGHRFADGGTAARGRADRDRLRPQPAKIPSRWGEQVKVVVGEVSDAVISALGPSMDRKANRDPADRGHQPHPGGDEASRCGPLHRPRHSCGTGPAGVPDLDHRVDRVHAAHVHAPRLRGDHRHVEPDHVLGAGLDDRAVHRPPPKDCAPKGHIRSGSSAPTSSASRSPAPASPPSPPIRSARVATCIAQPPSATDHRRNLNGDLCPSSSPLPAVTSAEQPSKPSSTAAPTPPR